MLEVRRGASVQMVHCREKAAEVLTREILSEGREQMGLLGQRSSGKKPKTFRASEDALKSLTAFCFTVVREIKFGLIILGGN